MPVWLRSGTRAVGGSGIVCAGSGNDTVFGGKAKDRLLGERATIASSAGPAPTDWSGVWGETASSAAQAVTGSRAAPAKTPNSSSVPGWARQRTGPGRATWCGGSPIALVGHMSPVGRTVHRVDPKSMSVAGSVEGLGEPYAAAAGDGVLWVQDAADGTVAGVDPDSLAITERIPVGGPGVGGGIAAHTSGVWFRPANYLLGRMDPAAGKVTEIFADTPALGDVLVAFDSVWFSGYTKDTVWRITT